MGGMQVSNREGLKAYVNKLAHEVLEREIVLFTQNLGGIAKLATLTMLVSWQFFIGSFNKDWRESMVLVLPFYTAASLCFSINMLVVGISSWCMIYGPSLAVRGPVGSTKRAIAGLYSERDICFALFGCGQLFLMASGVLLAWIKACAARVCLLRTRARMRAPMTISRPSRGSENEAPARRVDVRHRIFRQLHGRRDLSDSISSAAALHAARGSCRLRPQHKSRLLARRTRSSLGFSSEFRARASPLAGVSIRSPRAPPAAKRRRARASKCRRGACKPMWSSARTSSSMANTTASGL